MPALTPKPGSQTTAKELKTWVNGRVGAKFQRVTRVKVLNEFPRNVAGKILKRELRDAFES